MKLRDFMRAHAPKPGYGPCLFGEDWVLALNLSGGPLADGDYEVVRAGILRLESGFETAEEALYGDACGPFARRREVRRIFWLEGERRTDDPFQDHVFSPASLFLRGGGAALPYLFFCLRGATGERGEALPLVERDGGGAMGERGRFRLRLAQSGRTPQPYRWDENT